MKHLFALSAALILVCATISPAGADEAKDRKARSIAVLSAEGVPHIDHLPEIDTEAASTRRDVIGVVRRTVALAIVAVKGETGNHAMGQSLVEQFGAHGFFTPAEQAFMDDPNPSQQDRVNFTWRYEGVHVMLWALGIYPELGRPDRITDVQRLAATLRDLGTGGLLEQAQLRSQAEILDAADLIYRYNWATTDARINGRPMPGGLDGGVVYERHYALKWLIGYAGQAWDDITTDT